MHCKISCSAWRIKQVVKFIDKNQNAAILKLSPLLHGLSEDISFQKNSQDLQITLLLMGLF